MEKQRDLQFDIVRVLATFWIIGGWHVMDVFGWHIERKMPYAFLTFDALAGFMFMSGYFLSKYTFDTRVEVVTFYKKRMIRFFPLFALSAITMFIIGDNPGRLQLVLTLTGLSSYFGKQPWTVWFISMLFSFYLMTPLLSKCINKMKFNVILKLLVIVFGTSIFVYLLSLTPLDYDKRLSYAMPAYCIGLLLGKTAYVKQYSEKWWVAVISIVLCGFFAYFNIHGIEYGYIDGIIGVIALLSISNWLKYLPIRKVIEPLSYASMCVYLFHMQCYEKLPGLLHLGGVEIWSVYLVLIPIIVILSYAIQFAYDKLIEKLGL